MNNVNDFILVSLLLTLNRFKTCFGVDFEKVNIDWLVTHYRSSHHRCLWIKGALRNFEKFAGKHLWQSLFFKKVAGNRPERHWHRCFSVNFEKFLRTPFSHIRKTAPVTINKSDHKNLLSYNMSWIFKN